MKQERKELESGLNAFDINERRFKEVVRMMDDKRNRYILDISKS